MRGSPLIRALLAFCIILLAGYPLWRLTEPDSVAASVEEPAAAPEQARPIHLDFMFTRQPAAVKISHLGKEVWAGNALEKSAEAKIEVPYPDQGVELVFSVNWPEGEPAAMRIRLRTPAGDEHERTIWGEGDTTEVLSFP